jgi:hypothetical protein
MMNLTVEEIEVFKNEFKKREQFLLDHGWQLIEKLVKDTSGKEVKAKLWHDTVRDKRYPYSEGYDQLTMIILRENSWGAIKEILHLGKNKDRIETWGRFQSPLSGRVYSFLEAQSIMENNWSESIFPDGCSEKTRLRNSLIGENFQGDTIKIWYYQEGNKKVFDLWKKD